MECHLGLAKGARDVEGPVTGVLIGSDRVSRHGIFSLLTLY